MLGGFSSTLRFAIVLFYNIPTVFIVRTPHHEMLPISFPVGGYLLIHGCQAAY